MAGPKPDFLRIISAPILLIARLLYKVHVYGREKLPPGGALIVANHLSYVDAMLIQLACPRRLRPIGDANYLQFRTSHIHWFFRIVYKLSGTIPISPEKSLGTMRAVQHALAKGEYVLMFPEGGISRTGQLMEIKRGFELIAAKAGVPVIPVGHQGIWGSIFSFFGRRYLFRLPRITRKQICVVWGDPIPPAQANVVRIRRALLDTGTDAFEHLPLLQRNLAVEAARALVKKPWKKQVIDCTTNTPVVYNSGKLVAAASALSRHILRTIPEKRVGIVLPPSAATVIVNLATMFAGKSPVNLNFTAGRAAVESSIRLAGIKTIITADAMKERLPQFPWTQDTRDLKAELLAIGGKKAVLPWLLAAWLVPNQLYPLLLGLSKKVCGDDEAALLFTSGSSGDPKGVALSHRNVLGNCLQISSMIIVDYSTVLLGSLPTFHSFGFICMMFPILGNCRRLVTVPSPLETRKIIDTIYKEKITLMVAAPTFLRPILKKALKHELASLKVIVSGAEKMPIDINESFVKTFGHEVMQGYGLTETAPVCNVNQPDPDIPNTTTTYQPGNRLGSVGRLLPGISPRIIHPDTKEELPETESGILCLRGVNVFKGYLDNPEQTAKSFFREKWFITRDLAHFDKNGFLFIEGRISRFSKIGGEMVPHDTIERKIDEVFEINPDEGITNVIIGVSDPTKGEALVLLTTHNLTIPMIRERLLIAGIPNLWIPKVMIKTDAIPMLGTGKVDFASAKQFVDTYMKAHKLSVR